MDECILLGFCGVVISQPQGSDSVLGTQDTPLSFEK